MKKIRIPFLIPLALTFAILSPALFAHAELCSQTLVQHQFPTVRFGKTELLSEIRGPGLSVFVWNIHKAEDSDLPGDFNSKSEGVDIVLFQESVSSPIFTDKLAEANTTLGWSQTKAFEMSPLVSKLKGYTGVATASRFQPIMEKALYSVPKEPIMNTPKSILLSEFKIKDRSETLLVANIHAINFVFLASYKEHIRQLVKAVKNHLGPLVIAGDFNTWGDGRMDFLKNEMAKLGTDLIDPPQNGLLKLDHMFVRGLKIRYIQDLSYITSSDHSPMMVDFLID